MTERVTTFIDSIERVLIVIVSRAVPWASPMVPAYFIARAMMHSLDAPWPIGWAAGIAVEGVGLAATHVTVSMYSYNQQRRKSDPEAPVRWGVAACLVYFVLGIFLAVVVEVWPKTRVYAPAVFFPMAGIGYLVLMLLDSLSAIKQAIAEEKAQRKTLRLDTNASGITSNHSGKPLEEGRTPVVEYSPTLEEHLDTIKVHCGNTGLFNTSNVRQWCDIGHSQSINVLNYGIDRNAIERVARGKYRFVNGKEEAL